MVLSGADPVPHVAEVGQIIRQARQHRGLPLVKITEQAGISMPTWRKVETGEPGVRSRTYEAVGRAFGIPGRLVTNAIDDPREVPALAEALGLEVARVDLSHISDQALLAELARRLSTRHTALSTLLDQQTGQSPDGLPHDPHRTGRRSRHNQHQQHQLR